MSSATFGSYAPVVPRPNEMHVHNHSSNGAQVYPSAIRGNNVNQAAGLFNPNFHNHRSHGGSFGQAQQVNMENPTINEIQGNQNNHYHTNTGRTLSRVF
jgi:hypothetical protein